MSGKSALIVCAIVLFHVQAFTQTNLALNKAVTVSSFQTGNGASNSVDGNNGTRWCAANSSAPQWLQVDLGAVYSLNNSEVMWEKTAAYKYQIETSIDQTTWTLKVDKAQNTNSQQTFYDQLSATARYVRISATGLPAGVWASIFEFRIFGSANVPPYIIAQPSNQTVTEGQTATFTISVGGSQPISYQWKKGVAVLPGATNATYTTLATTSGDNGSQYSCEVSNWYGTISSTTAILTIEAPVNLSKWIGTVDGKLYVDPNATKVGIGTSSPDVALQVQGDDAVVRVRDNRSSNENAVNITPTQISLRTNYPAPSATTTIGQGNISLFQGTGLSVAGMGPVSTVEAGSMRAYVPGSGSTSVDAAVVTLLGYTGPNPNQTILSPGSIHMGISNPEGPSSTTVIGKGEMNLFMGDGLTVSAMGPSSSVSAGEITASVPGSGSTRIHAGTITVNGIAPGVNPTVIGGGFIRTDVVYVGTSGWSVSAPDYVFAKDYKLMPLSKVESFVKKNGHLPEIPSAKEMENGKMVDLVDMNMKLLKKIEELTLHSINQEKRINQLENVLTESR